jgi:hypothetical protein
MLYRSRLGTRGQDRVVRKMYRDGTLAETTPVTIFIAKKTPNGAIFTGTGRRRGE